MSASIRAESEVPGRGHRPPDPARNMVLADLLDAMEDCDTSDILAVTGYAPPPAPLPSVAPSSSEGRSAAPFHARSSPTSPEPHPMQRFLFSRVVLPLLAVFSLSGCAGMTGPQIATAGGAIGAAACTLTAAIAKIADPTGDENEVLGIVCPEIVPAVNVVDSLVHGSGKPAQCTAWLPLDDSKRFGGDGQARPGQLVCADLKAGVESELAKPPAARAHAKAGR